MQQNKIFFIGIAGGSGSGKTTFLRELLTHFTSKEIALVSQDNYYKPRNLQQADANGVINFDLPESIDREHFFTDMEKLERGESIVKQEYNFNNPEWKPTEVVVAPAPVVIMEGLFVFHYSEIRSKLDYKVFIDAQTETRLDRRIKRDGAERGYPEHEVLYQWNYHVRPAEEKYLAPFKHECDLVIDNTHSFEDGLNQLVSIIRQNLALQHHANS